MKSLDITSVYCCLHQLSFDFETEKHSITMYSNFQSIRSSVTSFVDGVKAAGSYIMNAVLEVIHQFIAITVKTMLFAIFKTISMLDGNVVELLNNFICVKKQNTLVLTIDVQGVIKGIQFNVNNNVFIIKSPLISSTDLIYETLDINQVVFEHTLLLGGTWTISMGAIATLLMLNARMSWEPKAYRILLVLVFY